MYINGLQKLVFGVESIEDSRQFLTDFGLQAVRVNTDSLLFSTQDNSLVEVFHKDNPNLPAAIESGSTLRSATWAVESEDDLAQLSERLKDEPGFSSSNNQVTCKDPTGLNLTFEISNRKSVVLDVPPINQYGDVRRINQASPVYSNAEPIGIGHMVLYVTDLAEAQSFYANKLGFHLSDFYRDKGAFMRSSEEGPHHHLFLLHIPNHAVGINHIAYTVRDIHEVAGGGLAMNSKGWSTFLGPGRHPISSAYFWYVNSPLGGAFEYYTNDDYLTGDWVPRELEHSVSSFTEWAVEGGIDPQTRRQIA